MKNNPFCIRSFLLLIFFAILVFSIKIQAQTNEPDEQIKREMIAYVAQVEGVLNFTRPRLVRQNVSAETNAEKFSVIKVGSASEFSTPILTLAHKAFDLINEQRAEKGLEPLKWSEDMAKLARLHSENMARDKFFSHQEPDGSMVNNRADALGISNWRSIGENIAYNRGFRLPADSACEQWMQSTGHRENILNKKWKESGVGVAVDSDGTYYFTQVFILR
jgi:uncharacterized protein YkwD